MGQGGTIQTMSDGRFKWIGYYRDETNRIHRPSQIFETFEAAKQKQMSELAKKVISEHAEPEPICENPETVQEYYSYWRNKYWLNEDYYTFSTTRTWQSHFTRHIIPFIGDEKLNNIEFGELNRHFAQTSLSKKSYNNIKQAVVAMFSAAYDDGFIKKMPDIDVEIRIPKVIKKKREKICNILTEENFLRIAGKMRESGSFYLTHVIFLHETGLRAEELAFTNDDVRIEYDENNRIISGEVNVCRAIKRTVKNQTTDSKLIVSSSLKSPASKRTVPISAVAANCIIFQRKYYKEKGINTPYIFSSSTGTLLEQRNLLRAFHTAIRAINEESAEKIPLVGLHSLRKLFCKNMRDSLGFDWELIKDIMGHSDSSVTKRYYYSISKSDVKAASIALNSWNRAVALPDFSFDVNKSNENQDYAR